MATSTIPSVAAQVAANIDLTWRAVTPKGTEETMDYKSTLAALEAAGTAQNRKLRAKAAKRERARATA